MTFREGAAAVVFMLVVVAVITRPRRLDEAVSGGLGAAAMLVLGVVSPAQALAVLAGQWNLVGVAERGAPTLLAELAGILPLPGAELLLAHVIDNGVRGELDITRGRCRPTQLADG